MDRVQSASRHRGVRRAIESLPYEPAPDVAPQNSNGPRNSPRHTDRLMEVGGVGELVNDDRAKFALIDRH